MVMVSTQVAVDVREVTPEEIEFFQDHGWVKLPALVASDVAADLLARAKRILGENADDRELEATRHRDFAGFHDYYMVSEVDDLFRAVKLTPQLGRNAALLFGRDAATRSLIDLLAVKLPTSRIGQPRTGQGANPTDWHQDHGSTPIRGNALAFWLALDEVTPEMGSMQFYERSKNLGHLAGSPLSWPTLQALPLSPPLHLEPGDATAHLALCVHGAPENTTERPRWGWICNFFPADAMYTGAPSPNLRGAVMTPGEPLDHPSFPVVYDPADRPAT
jgi:hypothetical protein